MSLTNEQAFEEYEKAKDALNEIARSDAVSSEKREEARMKRDKLIDDYIQKAIDDVNERTEKYRDFITEMEAFIGEIERESRGPVEALGTLQEVVDGAAKILSE